MMVKKNITRAAVNWTAPLHVDETVTVRVAVPALELTVPPGVAVRVSV